MHYGSELPNVELCKVRVVKVGLPPDRKAKFLLVRVSASLAEDSPCSVVVVVHVLYEPVAKGNSLRLACVRGTRDKIVGVK